MTPYETVIGLEVHLQLKTQTKMFCACRLSFGDPPNTHVCPVCLGLPGALPVLNDAVPRLAIRAGLMLHCTIARYTKFDRKNYFYPDLPKAYQISQYDLPICADGHLEITDANGKKRIGITRIHMEEDAGKLVHDALPNSSLVDLNRAGTPLLEIVSEPDMRSPEEAFAYLTTLKQVMKYLDISDCNMEEGSLRCDANVSLRPQGETALGTKVEIKNMNSFRAVQRALVYEVERQTSLLAAGESITQETRMYMPDSGITRSMRTKEDAHDYRYFPDPDLLPLTFTDEDIAAIADTLPEAPGVCAERLMATYGLSAYDADVVTAERTHALFLEEAIAAGTEPKTALNWLINIVLSEVNKTQTPLEDAHITPAHFATLARLIAENVIPAHAVKTLIPALFATGKDPHTLIDQHGLRAVTDTNDIATWVVRAAEENPDVIDAIRSGKDAARGRIVGAVMRLSKGAADPAAIHTALDAYLSR